MINWKLVAIILISVIIAIIIGYSQWNKENGLQVSIPEKKIEDLVMSHSFPNKDKKIKHHIQNQEDFKKIKIPENMILYYFPGECPHYTKEIFLYVTSEGLDKYFVPEEKTLILVKKDHKWTNEPNGFLFWQSG
jgi:hypothetical protein